MVGFAEHERFSAKLVVKSPNPPFVGRNDQHTVVLVAMYAVTCARCWAAV
jgi:hypothetical protein